MGSSLRVRLVLSEHYPVERPPRLAGGVTASAIPGVASFSRDARAPGGDFSGDATSAALRRAIEVLAGGKNADLSADAEATKGVEERVVQMFRFGLQPPSHRATRRSGLRCSSPRLAMQRLHPKLRVVRLLRRTRRGKLNGPFRLRSGAMRGV